MWRQELSLGKYKQTLLHPRGEKKGTYFNTSLSRRLLCLRQLSGHFLPLSKRVPFCFPKFSIQTLKLQYLAQHLSYNRALQPQHTEFCAQWAKLTIFLHSCLATFCDATFRLTLSKWWQEGKTYQKSLAILSPDRERGLFLTQHKSLYWKMPCKWHTWALTLSARIPLFIYIWIIISGERGTLPVLYINCWGAILRKT